MKKTAAPGLSLVDMPPPTIGDHEILIKIRKTAICGTDLHIYQWDEWANQTIKVPLVIGHEFVGEVVDLGKKVKGFAKGDRVSGEGHINCGYCRNCRAGRRHLCRNHQSVGVTRDGAFAEFLAIPAVNAFKIPNSIPDEIAAFLDPLGNAVHTALSFDLVGEDVLINGAGPIGVMACAIAKHAAARYVVITDINEYRLDLAKKAGATIAVNVNKTTLKQVMTDLGMQEGFDVGLEVSGHPVAFANMIEHMVHGGRIAILGFLPKQTQIDWNQLIMKGLWLKGIYGREMYETWYKMTAMLQSGLNVRSVLTHEFPYHQFEEGFAIMKSGQCGKVVLDWTV